MSPFSTFIGIMALQLVCSLKHPMWCKIFNFKWFFFHHIILYKNIINESFFMKLKNHLLWNKFQSMKVQKNYAMTSKNGHSSLQTSLEDSNMHLMKVYIELGNSNMQMGVCFDLGNSQVSIMKVCFCLRGSHMHIGTQFWSKELTNVHDGVFILVLGAQMVSVLEVKMFCSWMICEVYFGLVGSNMHNVGLFWSKESTNVHNGVCFNLESSNMHNANFFSSSNIVDMHNGSLFWFW